MKYWTITLVPFKHRGADPLILYVQARTVTNAIVTALCAAETFGKKPWREWVVAAINFTDTGMLHAATQN